MSSVKLRTIFIVSISTLIWSITLMAAGATTIRSISYIKSSPKTSQALCERLTFWQSPSETYYGQASFHGILQLVSSLRSAQQADNSHEIITLIKRDGETRYPAYLYMFCADTYSSQERDTLLNLMLQVTSPQDAIAVLESLGSRNMDISNDVQITIQFYEQLVLLAPTNQVGNARLSQLHSRLGQWEDAVYHAQATINNLENTRFTLIGYSVLSRGFINRGLCQEAQKNLEDMWQRFENTNTQLYYQALGLLSEAYTQFARSSCDWPTGLPNNEVR